jgi:hypothetical protein
MGEYNGLGSVMTDGWVTLVCTPAAESASVTWNGALGLPASAF